MKGWSRSSMSVVSSCAPSASVRATQQRRDAHHIGRQPGRVQRADERPIGTSTLPPRWPHFFSEASWSSKWTPAAPASIIDFISSKAFSGAAETGLGIGDDGSEPIGARAPSSVVDLVGALQRVVDAPAPAGTAWRDRGSGRDTSAPAVVGVRGDLPARQIDRLEPRLYRLHRLIARERAKRAHKGRRVQRLPKARRAAFGQRMRHAQRASELLHVLGSEVATDAIKTVGV